MSGTSLYNYNLYLFSKLLWGGIWKKKLTETTVGLFTNLQKGYSNAFFSERILQEKSLLRGSVTPDNNVSNDIFY